MLDDFITAHSEKEPPVKLSLATFKRGLNELEKAKIIAKTIRQGRYYINQISYLMATIAFTTLIERKKQDQPEQLDLVEPTDQDQTI